MNTALKRGLRGLPGGTTLAQLLARYRGHRPTRSGPRLSLQQIVRLAQEHERRTGKWPTRHSGDIPGTEETWASIEAALRGGWRGLPRGQSLFRLRVPAGSKQQRPAHR